MTRAPSILTGGTPQNTVDAPANQVAAATPRAKRRYVLRKQDCNVCGRTMNAISFSQKRMTANCKHKVQTCRKCIKGWITEQLKSKGWNRINCVSCSNVMTHDDINYFASRKAFTRYEELETKASIEQIPGFRWCVSPTCKTGHIHDDAEEAPIFMCNDCGTRACASCDGPWHAGETCAAAQDRIRAGETAAQNEESEKLIAASAKICPGPGCRRRCEKISGCDHMTCTMCGHEFCWQCLAAYAEIMDVGNSAHDAQCVHHYP